MNSPGRPSEPGPTSREAFFRSARASSFRPENSAAPPRTLKIQPPAPMDPPAPSPRPPPEAVRFARARDSVASVAGRSPRRAPKFRPSPPGNPPRPRPRPQNPPKSRPRPKVPPAAVSAGSAPSPPGRAAPYPARPVSRRGLAAKPRPTRFPRPSRGPFSPARPASGHPANPLSPARPAPGYSTQAWPDRGHTHGTWQHVLSGGGQRDDRAESNRDAR